MNNLHTPPPAPRGDRGEIPLDLYRRLRDLAHRLMRGEAVGHTLQTTALVHDAYMNLVASDATLEENPPRLLAAAGTAMRRALIDHARGRNREKRGGVKRRELVELSDLPSLIAAPSDQILELEEALENLAREDAKAAEIVNLRFHLGLDVDSTARVLDMSPRTVKRRWAFARSWLYRELAGVTAPRGHE